MSQKSTVRRPQASKTQREMLKVLRLYAASTGALVTQDTTAEETVTND
jgi:hypothetical protein